MGPDLLKQIRAHLRKLTLFKVFVLKQNKMLKQNQHQKHTKDQTTHYSYNPITNITASVVQRNTALVAPAAERNGAWNELRLQSRKWRFR